MSLLDLILILYGIERLSPILVIVGLLLSLYGV